MAFFLVTDDFVTAAHGVTEAGTIIDDTQRTIPPNASTIPYISAIHDPMLVAFNSARRVFGVARVPSLAGFMATFAGGQKLLESGGASLDMGAVATAQVLQRIGSDVIGLTLPASLLAGDALVAGEYAPALFDVTNIDASALVQARFQQIATMVVVHFEVTIDATATGLVELGIALPVASTFAAAGNLVGTALSSETVAAGGIISPDVANDRAELVFTAIGTGVLNWRGSFSYEVI